MIENLLSGLMPCHLLPSSVQHEVKYVEYPGYEGTHTKGSGIRTENIVA